MSHLIEGPGHSRHFAGMPNDFRSSGKVTASRSTRDALHVDLRGAAKRARDEAVVEGIRIVHRLAVDRDDQVGGLQAGPRRRPVGDHACDPRATSASLRAWRSFGMFVPDWYDARHPPNPAPSGAANLHQRELAAVALKSSWSHRMLVRFFMASGRIHPAVGGDYMTKIKFTTAALGLAGALATSQVHAQSASSGDQEIALLKQQLRLLEQKLDKTSEADDGEYCSRRKCQSGSQGRSESRSARRRSRTPTRPIPVKGPVAPSGVVVTMPNNRPTICTADEQNCVAITSRVHWDVGGYDFIPTRRRPSPQKLDSGENVRRARIGVIGKFLSDWNFALIYDFGGSSDGFGGTASAGGVPVGFLPGGGTSGIENAYLSYTGLKPFGGKMAVEGGIMDIPYTLDEATSSNDILFMERASAQVIAVNIAAGDFRSTVGTRWWNDMFWAGAYVTGPTTGAIHSASSINPPGTTEQYGAVARAAGQIISGNGLLAASRRRCRVADPAAAQPGDAPRRRSRSAIVPNCASIPTTLISTGAIANASGAQVYSVEAAATYGPLFFQGEYFWFNVDRSANTGLPPIGAPSLKFQGGYAQASYVLTGETRTYNPASASYGGINPANPFSLTAAAGARGKSPAASARWISTISSAPRPASPAGSRLVYTAGAELVPQSQRPLHARTICMATFQAGERRPTRRCRARSSTRSRCGRSSRSEFDNNVRGAALPFPIMGPSDWQARRRGLRRAACGIGLAA